LSYRVYVRYIVNVVYGRRPMNSVAMIRLVLRLTYSLVADTFIDESAEVTLQRCATEVARSQTLKRYAGIKKRCSRRKSGVVVGGSGHIPLDIPPWTYSSGHILPVISPSRTVSNAFVALALKRYKTVD